MEISFSKKVAISSILLMLVGGVSSLVFFPSFGTNLKVVPILIILGLVFLKPFWGFMGVVFFISLGSSLLRLSPNLGLLKLLALVVFSAYLLHLAIRKEKTYYFKQFTIALFFVLWLFSSLIWATYIPPNLFSRVISFVMLLGLFYITPQLVRTEKELNTVLLCYTLGGIVSAILCYKNFIDIRYSTFWVTPRARAFAEEDPTYYAFTLAPAYYYIFIKSILTESAIKRIGGIALSIGVIFSGILSGTRAILVGVAISSLFLLVLVSQKERFVKVLIIVMVSAVAVLVVHQLIKLYLPTTLYNRILSWERIHEGLYNRIDIYKIGLVQFLEHPLLGVGLGNSSLLFTDTKEIAFFKYGVSIQETGTYWSPGSPSSPSVIRDPHNSFILVLAEGGIIGFGLFIWLWMSILLSLWRAFRETTTKTNMWTLGLILLIVLLHFIVADLARGSISHQPLWLFWGLPISYFGIIRRKRSERGKAYENQRNNSY